MNNFDPLYPISLRPLPPPVSGVLGNNFTYIAYGRVENATGANFYYNNNLPPQLNGVFDTAYSYWAILVTNTKINSPSANDFLNRWVPIGQSITPPPPPFTFGNFAIVNGDGTQTNQRWSCPNLIGATQPSSWSLQFWAIPQYNAFLDNTRVVFTFGSPTTENFLQAQNMATSGASGGFRVFTNNGSNTQDETSGTLGYLQVNQRQHFCIIKTPTSLAVYCNNQLVNNPVSYVRGFKSIFDDFSFGAGYSQPYKTTKWKYAYFVYYDVAISSAERELHYNNGQGVAVSQMNNPNIRALWVCDAMATLANGGATVNNSTQGVTDASGNGNHLYAVGGASIG